MIKPTQAVFLGFITGTIILIIFSMQIALTDNIAIASSENTIVNKTETSIEVSYQSPLQAESCELSEQFPSSIQQWCKPIISNSQKYNIDKELLAAVMLQESGGDANAYSKSGAVGLMQVMPRDGIAEKFICINGPCFANRPTMDELFDPDFNIEFGARYLSNLYTSHGNWRDALKSYGPMEIGYYYSDLVLNIVEQYK
jgi:soluble lytic murein transglycosylase-like protein